MLGDRRLFLAIGGILGSLAILSFVAFAILKVATGHGLDVYYSPRGVPLIYVSALAGFVFGMAALIFAVVLRVIGWYRQR